MSESNVLKFETREDKIFNRAESLIGREALISFTGTFAVYTVLGTLNEAGYRGVSVSLQGFRGWLPLDGIEVLQEVKSNSVP